jgi:hypothetical protein
MTELLKFALYKRKGQKLHSRRSKFTFSAVQEPNLPQKRVFGNTQPNPMEIVPMRQEQLDSIPDPSQSRISSLVKGSWGFEI